METRKQKWPPSEQMTGGDLERFCDGFPLGRKEIVHATLDFADLDRIKKTAFREGRLLDAHTGSWGSFEDTSRSVLPRRKQRTLRRTQ